jgi:hypothetical protein
MFSGSRREDKSSEAKQPLQLQNYNLRHEFECHSEVNTLTDCIVQSVLRTINTYSHGQESPRRQNIHVSERNEDVEREVVGWILLVRAGVQFQALANTVSKLGVP